MGLTKRGSVWWIRFKFEGQLVWESAKTDKKTEAERYERNRRSEMEQSVRGADPRRSGANWSPRRSSPTITLTKTRENRRAT